MDGSHKCYDLGPGAACLLVLLACGGEEPGDDAMDGGTWTGWASTSEADEGATSDEGPTTGEPGEFGPEEEFVLRIDDDPVAPVVMTMNRDELAALFGDAARDILLVEFETTSLIEHSLDAVKTACGTAWQDDTPAPQYDCDATELGETFAPGPGGTWESSPELALIRILTMTPANARVGGTTLANMQGLADAVMLGGGFGEILADILGISRTQEFIPTAALTAVLQRGLLATHPAIGGDGTRLRIYLDDALADLTTLTAKLGPTGAHPGVLDPDSPTRSEVLTAEFALTIEADSNLRMFEGVDLSAGKGYLSTIVDGTGPSFDDPLEFDFEDPTKLSIVGVAPDPRVDLRLAFREHDEFVASCTGETCKLNLPENADIVQYYWPDTSVWRLDPWLIEALVASAARETYADRVVDLCYVTCDIARVLLGPEPPGWLRITTILDLGNPPPEQYVWELLDEVAQVALHDPPGGEIAEGEADVAFTLRDVEIGVTGPQLAELVRPHLRDQASKLAALVLGDFWKHNDAVDFYARRGADGVVYAFHVGAGDLGPGAEDAYAGPGFYTCPERRPDCKASRTAIAGSGDEAHEKLRLEPGETVVYVADDAGDLFRARFDVPAGEVGAISVRVAAAR